MSERARRLLTISTKNVSADGAAVRRGAETYATEVTEDVARAALAAFALVPAVELVEIDAKIYLAGPLGKVAVQNVGGRLFVTMVPEAVNTATERTPEETLAMLTSGAPGVSAEMHAAAVAHDAAIVAATKRDARGWRGALRSTKTLAVLLTLVALCAYGMFGAATPEGVKLVRDPAKISGLHQKLNGRYGLAGATQLVLENGKLTGAKGGREGAAEETLFALNYRFGQRGDEVVLLASNGALLERQSDASLKFLNSVYPRLVP